MVYSNDMQHADYMIDLVDTKGNVTSQKPRRAINKREDLYHTIHVVLITPTGELVLTRIPERKDLPNIYADQLGTTVATIRRSNENADRAALRAISHELFINNATVYHVGDAYRELDDGIRTYMSVYYLVAPQPKKYSRNDIQNLITETYEDFRQHLRTYPHEIAPTMRAIWKMYEKKLPELKEDGYDKK